MTDGNSEERLREERLPEELRALGRGADVPSVDGASMAERVLAQLLAEAVPVPVVEPPGRWARLRDRLRGRRRVLAAALSGLLVVLMLTPPVRAAVADWFDFGGVRVRYDPSASPQPSAVVPGCGRPGGRSVGLAEAARRAGIAPRMPAELGAPDAVSLSPASGSGGVLSLCWREEGRTVQLDEFGAWLDIGFVKQVQVPPRWVELSGARTALWFEQPHLLRFRLLGGNGVTWTESVRTAGPTLLWEERGPDGGTEGDVRDGAVTLRLEGVASPARAKSIAESVR